MDKLRDGIDLYLAGDNYAAIRILKEYIAEKGAMKGTAYYHIGIAYSDLGLLQDACFNLSEAAKLEPNKSMYHYRLGVIYSRLMALDKAAEHLLKAIEINPEHQRSRFILGTVYFRMGDMQKACDTFSEVIKISHDFAEAYFNRYQCLYHSGKSEAAAKDLEKALELNPNYSEARLALSQHYAANYDYKMAADNLKLVYDSGYRDYPFLKFYISTLIKNADEKRAKEVTAEAMAIYPNNADIEDLVKDLK